MKRPILGSLFQRGSVSKRTSRIRHGKPRPCQRAIMLLTALSMFLVSCDQNGNVADSERTAQSVEREAEPARTSETPTSEPLESEGEARRASDAGQAGWTIGFYHVADEELEQFGGGTARTDQASQQVLELDVALNLSDSRARVVVNDEGTFIGGNGSGRNIWIDITDPSGLPPREQAVGFASAVKPGSEPVRSITSGGRQFDVFESPGDALITGTTSILSQDGRWTDAAGQTRRMIRYVYLISEDVVLQTLVTIADRDDSISVSPPSIRQAIPAAAAIRRVLGLRQHERGAAPRGAVNSEFAAGFTGMTNAGYLLASNQPTRLLHAQAGTEDTGDCNWEDDGFNLLCPEDLALDPPTFPELPPIHLPDQGDLTPEPRQRQNKVSDMSAPFSSCTNLLGATKAGTEAGLMIDMGLRYMLKGRSVALTAATAGRAYL